jgi:hypothetical protein
MELKDILTEKGFFKDDIFFSFMRIFLKLIGVCLIFCM